jgi:leader peptidase (prepilin peptidase)/N-methyltransferase
MPPHTLLHITATLIGLVLGSFVNVALVRLPAGRGLWWPGSACDVCGTPLRWYDNVPVLSWLWLRGRCGTCHTPIPAFHPLIEALGGALAWLVFLRFVPGPASIDAPQLAAAAIYFVFVVLLLIAAFVDLRTHVIPDEVSLGAIPLGIAGNAALDALGYDGWLGPGWKLATLGAFAAFALLGGLSLTWRLALGRDGLGWGDVRLLAMIGAFVGPLPGLWTVLLLACVIGVLSGAGVAIATRRSAYLPFGPAIAAAAIAYVLYGDALVRATWPGLG